MRLSLLATVVVGATLAQVGASPLRVVVITNNPQELPSVQNLRFGHALADSHVAKISTPNHRPLINLQQPGPRPCGKRIKDKAIQISNVFRHALGLPLIEIAQARPGDNVHGGMVHILPFIGTPPTFIEAGRNSDLPYSVKSFHHKIIEAQSDVKPHRHHRHHHFQHWEGNTFMARIHNALMSLGPWEGRAVAFVLGCGIGVLLRMLWVLTVVTFRTIRGERDDGYTQVAVVEEYVDAEDIVVPPPTYTVGDEKEQIKAKGANEN